LFGLAGRNPVAPLGDHDADRSAERSTIEWGAGRSATRHPPLATHHVPQTG
jgi:hypothetical protein